jgi:hypothetical protein
MDNNADIDKLFRTIDLMLETDKKQDEINSGIIKIITNIRRDLTIITILMMIMNMILLFIILTITYSK